jgi:L-alanine-DL-glutamate epimerase-like enolase superfamily enzyme
VGHSIIGVTAYRVRLPLIRPYHLSFGALEAYDSLFVQIQSDEGEEGFGEATDCPGYFVQGISDAWDFVGAYGPELPGKDPQGALDGIINREDHLSFGATPLLTALETLISTPKEKGIDSERIPLLGIVQGETLADMIADAQRLMKSGYQTLKMKVGFSVREDLDRVGHLQAHLEPGIQVRLDANQGYDYSQAVQFLEGLDPGGIELLEQPLDPGAWDDMARLAKLSQVPLMLDEAINTEEDLDRTLETGCARAVKFKLMKCGSMTRLEEMIRKASSARLKVILGNGVATDVGCLHEAQVGARLGLTVHAGEMNGFLKGREKLLQPSLRVDKGALILPSASPVVRWELVSKLSQETATWGHISMPGRSQ